MIPLLTITEELKAHLMNHAAYSHQVKGIYIRMGGVFC